MPLYRRVRRWLGQPAAARTPSAREDRESFDSPPEQRLRGKEWPGRALDTMAVGVYSTDAEGRIQFYNEAATRIWGRTPGSGEKAAPKFCGSLKILTMNGQHLPHEHCPAATTLRTGEAINPEEVVFERPDGSQVTVMVTPSPLFNEQGKVIGMVNCMVDISKRKPVEKALRESEQRFHSIFEAARDPVLVYGIDPAGYPLRFLEVNNAACRLYGYSRQELTGMPVENLIWPPERRERFPRYFEQMQKEGSILLDAEQLTKSCDRIPVEVRAQLIEWAGQPAVLAVVRDVTLRKRVEAELRAFNERLEEQVAERTQELEAHARQLQIMAAELTDAEQRERKRLAQVLHDDLQQILVAARMRMGCPEHPPNSEQAEQARRLITCAIDTSRSLSKELAPPVLYDLGLAPALEWLETWAWEKYGLRVNVFADEEAIIPNQPFRLLLFDAVKELLLNVVKHAGVSEATVILKKEGESIALEVHDPGKGFSAASLSEHENRYGFGLFSLKQRLPLMGGKVELDGAPGEGTRVRIVVPAEWTTLESSSEPMARQEGR